MTDNIFQKFLEGFQKGYFLRVGSNNSNTFIGRDEEGKYCFEFRGKFRPIRILGSKPLLVNQYKSSDENFILRFSLESNELIECFSSLCEDMLNSIRNLTDENLVYKTLYSRYQSWKKLFKPNRATLSEIEIMGLIGELLFFKNCAIPKWGINTALESWTGPEKTHKDFSNGNEWYEIKTISTGKESVKISSIEQLDSDIEGTLYVYSIEKMSPSFNGIKLNSLVKDIMTGFNIIQKDLFISKLELFGFHFDPNNDNLVYALTDKSVYRIVEGFPRLRRNNIPLEISKIQYDITLSEITQYKLT